MVVIYAKDGPKLPKLGGGAIVAKSSWQIERWQHTVNIATMMLILIF